MLQHALSTTSLPPLNGKFIEGVFDAFEADEAREARAKAPSKKDRVLDLYHQGIKDVAAIGRQINASILCRPGVASGWSAHRIF